MSVGLSFDQSFMAQRNHRTYIGRLSKEHHPYTTRYQLKPLCTLFGLRKGSIARGFFAWLHQSGSFGGALPNSINKISAEGYGPSLEARRKLLAITRALVRVKSPRILFFPWLDTQPGWFEKSRSILRMPKNLTDGFYASSQACCGKFGRADLYGAAPFVPIGLKELSGHSSVGRRLSQKPFWGGSRAQSPRRKPFGSFPRPESRF